MVFAPRAFEDIDRIADFLLQNDPEGASTIGALLRSGIEILGQHPLVGRLIEHRFRELVISRGRSGYVALYKYDPIADIVVILAISPQREGGLDQIGNTADSRCHDKSRALTPTA